MSQVATVTAERKQALLLEARKTRISWVQSSLVPYRTNIKSYNNISSSTTTTTNDTCGSTKTHHLEPSSLEQSTQLLLKSSSYLFSSLPSVIPLLQQLFQGTSLEEQRQCFEPWIQELKSQEESSSKEKLIGSMDDHAFLFYYQDILEKLCLPESKDVIQSMKQFIKSLEEDMSTSASKMSNAKASSDDSIIISYRDRIQKYLEELYNLLSSHSVWRENDLVEDGLSHDTQMMLETFLYSKCHECIQKVLLLQRSPRDGRNPKDEGHNRNRMKEEEEVELEQKLAFLHNFGVKPSHLEIHAWDGETVKDIDTDLDKNVDAPNSLSQSTAPPSWSWEKDLARPIALLKGLETLYSPAQILRSILDIYRGINDTLQKLFNRQSEGTKVLPSADDILPTLILAVICARPRNILLTLQFVEYFATDAQKRGEHGYAFATLYSAIRFVQEISLDSESGDEKGKPRLLLSPKEMKEMMGTYVNYLKDVCQEQQRENPILLTQEQQQQKSRLGELTMISPLPFQPVNIPVSQVSAARMRGENLLQWAEKYISSLDEEYVETVHQMEQNHPLPPLPAGFHRSYKYLSTDPNNIRFSDVPEILEEYSILVKTVETLISERHDMVRQVRKESSKQKKDQLEASLAEIQTDLNDSIILSRV